MPNQEFSDLVLRYISRNICFFPTLLTTSPGIKVGEKDKLPSYESISSLTLVVASLSFHSDCLVQYNQLPFCGIRLFSERVWMGLPNLNKLIQQG